MLSAKAGSGACLRPCAPHRAQGHSHTGPPPLRAGWPLRLRAQRHGCPLQADSAPGLRFKRQRSRLSCQAALADALQSLALLPGVCFDRACQEATDRAFLLALAAPLATLAGAIAWIYRPLPPQEAERQEVFSDPETGAVFEGRPGAEPERDRFGELAFRPISYTPWPVEASEEGVRLRVPVGPVGATALRTYVFPHTLPGASRVFAVALPRPLGLVLEEDARRGRVVVRGFVPGSAAEQRAKVAALNQGLRAGTVQEGDVLRAATCTNFVFAGSALWGGNPPVRTIVLYGADGQKWPQVIAALKKGVKADGPVTLVLERRIPREELKQLELSKAERAKFDY